MRIAKLDPNRYYVEFADACSKEIVNKDCSKYFKRYDTKELPRVQTIVGMLKGINPGTVLDVGTGRGRLFWPMVHSIPNARFTALELVDWRCEVIRAVSKRIDRISLIQGDISIQDTLLKQYDVVIASEVLEHIPLVLNALLTMETATKHHMIITVPSKLDNNPDHIHFLTKDKFEMFFKNMQDVSGRKVERLVFSHTPKELVVHARLNHVD